MRPLIISHSFLKKKGDARAAFFRVQDSFSTEGALTLDTAFHTIS
jgi:hypothetical protein